MTRKRDDRFDGRALQLIGKARSIPQWMIFRHPGGYEDRLALQRAIYYLGANPTNPNGCLGLAITVEWRRPGDGAWEKLKTPRGGGENEGTPVGRLKVYDKEVARSEIRKRIESGTNAYNCLETSEEQRELGR